MIEYVWRIDRMKTITKPEAELNDYVYQVFYCLDGKDTESDRVESVCGDRVFTVTPSKPAVFVEFKDLTYETVVGWLEHSLGKSTIESFKKSIEDRLFIQEKMRPPPWLSQNDAFSEGDDDEIIDDEIIDDDNRSNVSLEEEN